MTDHSKVVDFDSAKEPLLHRRRESKVKRMRNAFKAAREAVAGRRRQKEPPGRPGRRNKKKR